MARQRHNLPELGLAIALAAAAVLLISLTWPLTFFQDTWAFLLERPGLSAHSLLTPHNEHLVVFQVALEKLLIAVFGMASAHPENLVMTASLLGCGALLFFYVRRRLGPWPALLATILLLFLGAGWQVELWGFEIAFTAPLLAGLAILLLLERDDRLADVLSCLLLIVAIGFGSLGLSFAAAALVDVYLKRQRRGWGRIWFVLIPLGLYAAWYLGWGHEAEHHLTLRNILDSPIYLFEGFASSVGSLFGLSTTPVTGQGQPEWGRPLLVALTALAIYRMRRRPLPPTFWPVAAAALSFWLLAGFNFIPGREATSLRYVYAGAAFVLLLAAELLSGTRFSPRALWVGAALTVLAVMPNLVQMKDGADWLEEQTVLTRADTAAIEIAQRTVDPEFRLAPEVAGTGSLINVSAGRFLEVAAEDGSPSYSPSALAAAPEPGPRQADIVLAQALPLTTSTEPGTFDSRGGEENCTTVSPASPQPPEGIALSPGVTRLEVAPGGEVQFKLRRFSPVEFPVPTAAAPGRSTTLLKIPRDKAPQQQWHLQVEAAQLVRVCR